MLLSLRLHRCWQRCAGDYLVPLSPRDQPASDSSTDHLVPHSKTLPAAERPGMEDSQYQPLLKASQEYGNIPTVSLNVNGKRDASNASAAETKNNTKCQQSESTDRLLSSLEGPVEVAETSFTETKTTPSIEPEPTVEKLISITPTSPKPPENALSIAIDSTNVIDKTNKTHLIPEKKSAPIASPDPPRINAWNRDAPAIPKPKPFCLDAAQLEQNLNALKKNSGSVNLTTMNTMKVLPPYINVVTPNKISEAKTIQIDPKKAVIHDLQSPSENEDKEKGKLKQSSSAASLLNGPLTELPYADSDNASSSSGSNTQNINQKNKNYSEITINGKNVKKQNSNGGETEINC
ncbi:unnamed protein product [Danaus chrysippus]|uniref:(African queen) hypothetical protein n=1 Tax=Danaus chrysippus TaxID=151541 RepID=A0A8J2R7C0_9NEOP|nr:unnamed protein product [Danaus chrysippus]